MKSKVSKNNFDVVSSIKSLVRESLEDGKAQDVVTVDLKGKTDVADCMIIASGRSNTHTSSLAENLIKELRPRLDGGEVVVEGMSEGNWVLVDLGGVIVHIFKPEYRDMYKLEKMWAEPLS